MLSTCGLLGVYYKSIYGLLPLQGRCNMVYVYNSLFFFLGVNNSKGYLITNCGFKHFFLGQETVINHEQIINLYNILYIFSLNLYNKKHFNFAFEFNNRKCILF
jgi:hypothetical protein